MNKEKILGSIIILNWNRKDDLKKLLSSLLFQDLKFWEIIVVDNASTDSSVEMVKTEFPIVKIIEMERNFGVQGYNIGARQGQGQLLFFIDNDMVLKTKGALQKIEKYFQKNKKLGALALKVVDFYTNEPTNNNPKYNVAGDQKHGYPASSFDGGGVVVKKDSFFKAGGYDARFFIYHTEVDLSTRLWNQGDQVRYFDDIVVAHKGSLHARPKGLHFKLFVRNGLWYIWKYYPINQIFVKSIKFIIFQLVKGIKDKNLFSFITGFISSFFGIPHVISMREKYRVKPEILRMLEAIRLEDLKRKQVSGSA